MDERFAWEIKEQLEAMSFPAWILCDDFNRCHVWANVRGQKVRFDGVHEFRAWYENFCDTHHSN